MKPENESSKDKKHLSLEMVVPFTSFLTQWHNLFKEESLLLKRFMCIVEYSTKGLLWITYTQYFSNSVITLRCDVCYLNVVISFNINCSIQKDIFERTCYHRLVFVNRPCKTGTQTNDQSISFLSLSRFRHQNHY